MSLRTFTFLDALRDGPLLNPAQRDELKRDLQPRFPDPKALARELLQRGWLTPYQINQLFQGNGNQLVLGGYLILERLGEGGTGQVYKARHQKMGRIVALKVIRPELLTDAEVVSRFYREVRVLSQLAHPNIVHAYDAGPVGAGHILVMEHVEGTDLSQRVKRDGPLPVVTACEYIRQAALGLQHVHENALVHRDIKPSNLLVTRVEGKDLIKLLDLGLARLHKVADGERTAELTPVGSVTMGTPDYLAPEQALDFHEADIRADIYSLGCTFYFLLTGQPPFPGGSMAQKLMRHQQVAAVPIEHYRADVTPGLGAVLPRLMAKNPEERYQTPGEVADAVAAAVGLGPVAVLLPDVDDRTVPMAVPLTAPPRRKRHWGFVAAAGLFLLLSGVGLVLSLTSPWAAGPITEGSSPARNPSADARQALAPPLSPVREQVRPDADESPWARLPWAATLWEARQRAAQQGKPILLWETDGPPLGSTSTDGISSRALVFTDAEILKLAREDFVPVGCDDWYQRRRRDPEGEFFRGISDQRNPRPAENGGRQGYYCLTADGKLLAYRGFTNDVDSVRNVFRQGLAEWNKLPEAQRKPGALTVGPPPIVDPKFARPAVPVGGQAVHVYTRMLEHDGRNEWRRLTTVTVPGTARSAHDTLWLTEADGQDLLAAGLRPGAQIALPRHLADRIARFHLVDNTRGEPAYWQPEEVRSLQVTLTVGDAAGDELPLTLAGTGLMHLKPEGRRSERGFEVRLAGQLSYDRKRKTWTRFDVTAVGDHWGDSPYCPAARRGRAPLGIVFELAEDESSPLLAPPAAARSLGGYLIP